MQKIDSAAVRLSKLVDGILKYSIVNAGKDDFETVVLSDVFKSIVTDLELMITQKQAVVSYDCDAVIRGVPLLIQQLFYNLLYNALKFSKPHVAPVVHVACGQIKRSDVPMLQHEPIAEDLCEITISDNGIGFSKENTKRIFEVFSRLHSPTQYEGTGLGLALCKKIVALHHGFIMAEGEEGKGAVFKIYLPAL